jgi:Dolichyl-phosphate-mannose-protein mannosyltransferase
MPTNKTRRDTAALLMFSGISAIKRLSGSFERQPWPWVTLFIFTCFTASVVKSTRLPVWLDEVYTFCIVQQRTASDVIQATREGCIQTPPLHALIIRSLRPAIGNGPLALRLPSAIGFYAMCLCVFAFVRKRLPANYAAVAMLIACISCYYYATEGRPYGLVLGSTAFALLCWQAADEGRRRPWALAGLGLSLAFGIALHYFPIFVLIPLLAGEVVRWRSSRRLDVAVLGALGAPPLILVPHLTMIRAAMAFVPHSVAKASLDQIPQFYFEFFSNLIPLCLAALVIYVVAQFAPEGAKADEEDGRPGLLSHETVACCVLALLPVLVVLLAVGMRGMFATRYVQPSVLGIAILVSTVMFRATRGSSSVVASLLIPLLVWMGLLTASALVRTPTRGEARMVLSSQLLNLPPDPAPIVFASHRLFLEVWFYADPKLRDRLVYPVSADRYRAYTGNDSAPRALSCLRRRMPMRLPDYDTFVASNRRFLLVTDGGEWLVWNLLKSGCRINPVINAPPKTEGQPGIYEVENTGRISGER